RRAVGREDLERGHLRALHLDGDVLPAGGGELVRAASVGGQLLVGRVGATVVGEVVDQLGTVVDEHHDAVGAQVGRAVVADGQARCRRGQDGVPASAVL